jgi:tetratricopeptide (TPR) repeat protein
MRCTEIDPGNTKGFMTQDKHKLKRSWVEQAVSLALRGRWDEAVAVNGSILSLFPNDADAYNRLGKAYTELGRYADARDAYDHTLRIDSFNIIARKNLQRLSSLQAEMLPVQVAVADTETSETPPLPQLFIETMGKTGTAVLVNPADASILARVTAGTPVHLAPDGADLAVFTARGERLGQLESRMSQRLLNRMKAGNRYAAAITALDAQNVRVIIRETYQHPSMAGRLSFPPKRGADTAFRAYTKESLLKLDEEDDERYADETDASGDSEPPDEPNEEQDRYEEPDLGDE